MGPGPERENRIPKRVLIATSSYPFHPNDFHALFVHEMAMELVECGVRVRVITPAAGPEWAGTREQDGIEIVRFKYPGLSVSALRLTGGDGIWQNIRQHPMRLFAIPGFLLVFTLALIIARKRFRPDGVIAHWLLPTGPVTSLAFSFSKTRILHLGHGSDVHLLARIPGRSLLTRLLNRNGQIAATSPFIQKKIATMLKNRHAPVIQLGVRGEAKPEKRANREAVRFCYMGRIVRGKGLYRALDLLRARPDWSLSIAGEGSETEKLKKRARANESLVFFQPPVLGPDKTEFLKKHDYFLFIPEIAAEENFQDNLPVSLLEALRHGLPVVATRLLGLRSVFGEQELIFVDGNPASVEEAIDRIDEQTHVCLSHEAYRTGLRFSWRDSIQEMLTLL